jgi:hypothetical protein
MGPELSQRRGGHPLPAAPTHRGNYERFAIGLMLRLVWRPIHFGMQRLQLLNLKRRVEAA